jgi:prephenate dehydrogenase
MRARPLTILASLMINRFNERSMHWQKVTIVGVGLLGGSLGLALKKANLAGNVVGLVRRKESIDECLRMEVVDECTMDLGAAVAGADLVVQCTPIAQMFSLSREMLPHLKQGAIVTDVGSVKGPIVRELEPLFQGARVHFVGSHPMAGAEKMGVSAARVDLFNGAIVVVTPTQRSHAPALVALEQLWKLVGAKVIRLSPETHDDLVSRSSHLPHVVAAELVNYVLSPVHAREQALLCATGFRDTTRIASGSPEMWRDIAMSNRANLARVLGVFIEDLQEFQLALDNGDEATIHEFFEKARQRREEWRARAGGE